MSLPIEEVSSQAALFLSEKWQMKVVISSIEQIFGGASRETYRLKVKMETGEQGIILRRDPVSSLIDTERELEYGAYLAIFPTRIPVPEPLFLENDPKWLGQPFSIMAEIQDATTDTGNLSDQVRIKVGKQKWQLLGQLAAMDPQDLGFDKFTPMTEPSACAYEQLDYWAKVILDDEIHPQPIAAAAIRWLRKNKPHAAQKLSVVHGDYRSGNFMFTTDGTISAVLDWEMCHIGDPLEDLAWSLDPLWSLAQPDLAGNLLPHQDAIAIWQQASGLKVDMAAFNWWRVFASVKGLAIWISSSEEFVSGEGKDAILAYAGWVMSDRQNKILLDHISPLSTGVSL